jgi:hypothetical protein
MSSFYALQVPILVLVHFIDLNDSLGDDGLMNVPLWTGGTTQCGQNIYIATLLTPALPDMKQTSTVPSGIRPIQRKFRDESGL